MSSVRKNFIYNIIYQILHILLPLITVPYVSRVIGAVGVGTYSYTNSIVYYFILISMLGINNYGNRAIAQVSDNKKKLSKTFLSIYSIQFIMSIICTIGYVVYYNFFENNYNNIFQIQLIYMISVIFDVNWFFFGLEKFKLTVTRNIFVKVFSFVLILIFVKKPEDIEKYTIIMTMSIFISQLLLFCQLKKHIDFVRIGYRDIRKHIKSCILLFVPVIAVSLYKIMDKIMIEKLSDVKQVGLYENAEKLVGVPLSLITALGTVMLPRMSKIFAKKDENKAKRIINKSIIFVMFMSAPMVAGLIAIGNQLAPVFFGKDFNESGILIVYLSVTIIFISCANVIRTQFLIPKEKDRIYIVSVILGAITNIIINMILIPKYKSLGAVIGTIFAEFIVMFYQFIMVKNELPIKKYLKDTYPFVLKSLIMYLIIIFLPFYIINNDILEIVSKIIIGFLLYCLFNYKYILLQIKPVIDSIKKKFEK